MAAFSTKARTPLDLATSVRDARLAAGMSQADLAAAARLNRSWVSLFESGHSPNASLGKVLAMLDALGITVRLTYTVPDSDSPAIERDPQTERAAKSAPATVNDTVDEAVPGSSTLDPVALAAARATRTAHLARAVADELSRRPAVE